MKKLSGIYKIENIINKNFYIGQSSNLMLRKRIHFNELKINCHKNIHLQNSFNKYGIDNFVFTVILCCENDFLTYYEQLIVDLYKPEYNIRKKCVDSNLGLHHSDEAKLKISNTHKGKILSDETKKKISASKMGTRLSDERKEQISIFMRSDKNKNRGRKTPDEIKNKISKSRIGKYCGENHPMFGKHWSEEVKLKNSISHRGENHPMFGKNHPKNVIEKMSISQFGQKKNKKSSSRYVGVSFVANRNTWRARITKDGKTLLIGYFHTEVEAALAYNSKALELYGKSPNIIKED